MPPTSRPLATPATDPIEPITIEPSGISPMKTIVYTLMTRSRQCHERVHDGLHGTDAARLDGDGLDRIRRRCGERPARRRHPLHARRAPRGRSGHGPARGGRRATPLPAGPPALGLMPRIPAFLPPGALGNLLAPLNSAMIGRGAPPL